MKVILGIDPICFPLTGIGRYTYELAQGLVRSKDIESVRFLLKRRLCDVLPAADTGLVLGGVRRSMRVSLAKSHLVSAAYRKVNGWLQARALRGFDNVTYHGPNYYLPVHRGPSVSTFHDLSVYRFPEFHPPERLYYMRQELPLALERTDVVVVDSNFVRDEMIAHSKMQPERVVVAPLAASSEFFPRASDECADVLTRHGLGYQEYCLFAGTVEPRKNLGRLLDAYEGLPVSLREHIPLVVVGYRGWRSEDLHRRLESAQLAGWVRYLGYVSAEDLPVLYAGARVFAFPSLYEGFGLPVLEAMASGVPVVCSNASSLPEVAGGHALMCEPTDVEALRTLIERAIVDHAWRSSVMVESIAHAKTFSWDKTVAATLEAYRLAESFQ